MIISFPGGAGGNWLRKVIDNVDVNDKNLVNFHQHTDNQNSVNLLHSLDPAEFNYLFSGTLYFNFYLNVMYKLFYHDLDLFKTSTYETAFLESVNTARYLCQFDTIKDHIFFNFNDLVDHDDRFFDQISIAQSTYNLPATSQDNFKTLRNRFLSTMVNPKEIYNNFDNMLWICFVLGQLMNQNIVPTDFIIKDRANQEKCQQFVLDNYKHCHLTDVHYFNTNVFFPKVLE